MYMSFPQVCVYLWKKYVICVLFATVNSVYYVFINGVSYCDLGPHYITNPLKCQDLPDTLRGGTCT